MVAKVEAAVVVTRPLAGDAFDEDVHDAAADLVVAVDGLRQVHGHEARTAVLERLHCLLPDLRLAAAAADGAGERAVGTQQHVRAGLAWGRPTRRGDSGEDARFAGLLRSADLSKELTGH